MSIENKLVTWDSTFHCPWPLFIEQNEQLSLGVESQNDDDDGWFAFERPPAPRFFESACHLLCRMFHLDTRIEAVGETTHVDALLKRN